jgi:hypothetical protein
MGGANLKSVAVHKNANSTPLDTGRHDGGGLPRRALARVALVKRLPLITSRQITSHNVCQRRADDVIEKIFLQVHTARHGATENLASATTSQAREKRFVIQPDEPCLPFVIGKNCSAQQSSDAKANSAPVAS